MSTAYESTGRTRQKARTRAALVAAARSLLAEGLDPTVELAADRADISRTTAYRYFPNRRALVSATYPELDSPSLFDGEGPADPRERLEIVTERFTRQVREHEPELRAQLRISLGVSPQERASLPLRQGRAIGWLEDALAPLRPQMSQRDLHRLALSIRATLGIEAYVWLVDVGRVSPDEAVAIMRNSARSLLAAALPSN